MAATKLVTAAELAGLLQVSVETVWRYTRTGRIPYVELAHRKYRYNVDKVMQALSLAPVNQPADRVAEASPDSIADKVYTYEDYLKIPDEERYHYEVLDGVLIREPAPNVQHQRVSRRLQRVLEDYFLAQGKGGEVFDAPIDVTLSDTTVIQPDLCYIPGDNGHIVEAQRVNGAPLLIVEIITPSSRVQDRVRKRVLYEKLQVPHYWIVDPEDETIEAYALHDGKYILRSAAAGTEQFTHPDLPGLAVDLAPIWRRGA